MSADSSCNRNVLIFSLHGTLYALDLALISEVSDPPKLSPIPFAPACYSGAMNFHGDIVAVMDLALLLGQSGCSHPGKIIVLHGKVASLAFLVDSVVRIISEDEVSFGSPTTSQFSLAKLTLLDGEATQLNLEALVLEAENKVQRSY